MFKYLLTILTALTISGQTLIDHYRFGSGTGNDLNDGLQAFYKFDEASGNAIDSSTNNRPLTQNGTLTSESGYVVNSRFHNVTDDTDYFSRADEAWNDFGTNDFTITFFTRLLNDDSSPDLTVIQDTALVSKSGGDGTSWIIHFDRGAWANQYAFQFYYTEDGAAFPIQLLNVEVDANFVSDAWYFVWVKRSGDTFTMGYTKVTDSTLSTTLVDTETQAITLFDSSGEFTVGSWLLPGGGLVTSQDLEGNIDELGVWNVALSDCQLIKLFRGISHSQFDTNPCL
jgi:hypothetical protein